MAEPNVIYKVTVLSLLNMVDFPLSNQQIVDFFLEYQYTEYFNVQTAIHELQIAKMIRPHDNHGQTLYELTQDGYEALALLKEKVNPGIEDDIKDFCQQNAIAMRQRNSLYANFCRSTEGGYIVHCKVEEDNKKVMDFTFHVHSKEQAESICNNWKNKYEDVYSELMEILM